VVGKLDDIELARKQKIAELKASLARRKNGGSPSDVDLADGGGSIGGKSSGSSGKSVGAHLRNQVIQSPVKPAMRRRIIQSWLHRHRRWFIIRVNREREIAMQSHITNSDARSLLVGGSKAAMVVAEKQLGNYKGPAYPVMNYLLLLKRGRFAIHREWREIILKTIRKDIKMKMKMMSVDKEIFGPEEGEAKQLMRLDTVPFPQRTDAEYAEDLRDRERTSPSEGGTSGTRVAHAQRGSSLGSRAEFESPTTGEDGPVMRGRRGSSLGAREFESDSGRGSPGF
jgi:hypothetical protein